MFTASALRQIVTRQPFQPFRVIMSNGERYDIKHHDTAMVTRNGFEVGLNPDQEGVFENIARCAILHIAQVEDLLAGPEKAEPNGAGNGGSKK
jgi:hypothetical protein